MSTYTNSYALAYGTLSVQQQIEVAVVTAAYAIVNEDPATADHANRLEWANWTLSNSSVAWQPFRWPVSTNPAIVDAYQQDPSGAGIKDSDVQFVVNSNLDSVIAAWVANQPAT